MHDERESSQTWRSLTDALDEVEIFRQEVFEVLLDQHFTDVQSDASFAVVVIIVQVVGFGRNIQDRLELDLSLQEW